MSSAHSLKKRYMVKLFANFIGVPLNFAVQLIVPRALGPGAYGDFNYLTNFFTQITGFIGSGTSMAFFVKASQRQREFGLVWFYQYFMFAGAAAIAVFVAFARSVGAGSLFWPGQSMHYVYLAFALAIFMWVADTALKLSDAYGLTVKAELARIVQRVSGLLILAVLFFSGSLNLDTYFYYNYFICILLLFMLALIVCRYDPLFFSSWKLWPGSIKKYSHEFYHYAHPLFVYGAVGLVAGLFDRWLLQKWSGSVQQGFFGLSLNLSNICFLAGSAMTPIIMREFSVAQEKKDIPAMAGLFRKYVPFLYSVTAFFCFFFAVNADSISLITGGSGFRGAYLAVAVMSLYPLHQVYGQLSGSLFYATGQTRLYRNIGIFFMLIGLPATFFLIAPRQYLGLDAGAVGLALKTVLVQFAAVNTQLYFNARFLKVSFLKYFVHQLGGAAIFLAVALVSRVIITVILRGDSVILNLVCTGILYSILVLALAHFFPLLFGLDRKPVQVIMENFRNGFSG